METYEPPVDQLLRLEDDLWEVPKDRHDYPAMGIGPEHVPDLLRLSEDRELLLKDDFSAEFWAPIHAWRALGSLRAEQAIPTFLRIIEEQDEATYGDMIIEELPQILAQIGPAAIPGLAAIVERDDALEHARHDAQACLVAIAEHHPQARDEVIAIIVRRLDRAESNGSEANGWIIASLLELKAKEAAGPIERAFAGDFVDRRICGDWYAIWHELELDGEPPPIPERLRIPRWFRDPWLGETVEVTGTAQRPPKIPGWTPTEMTSPEERKGRNKSRQKLEKKLKGKGKPGKRS